MALRTPDTKDEQDQAYNPSQEHYDREFNKMTENYSSSADDLQKLENHANAGSSDDTGSDQSEKSDPNKNIDDAKTKEESGSGWVNNVSSGSGDNNNKPATGKFNFLKKKGPMGAIIALIFGGGGVFTILFSPGMALVQLKEALLDDLNDQAAAMNLRSDHLLRAKLKGMQSGVCAGKVSIRCKFNTMSKREVKAFRNAGFKIEPAEADKVFGRTKPTKITFPDGTEITDPNQLRNHLRNSVEGRSAIRKAFNPKFAGVSDKISNSFFKRYKTDKSKKVEGDTKEERDKSITAATAGQQAGIGTDGKLKDEKGNEYVVDDDGSRVYAAEPDGGLPEGAKVDEGKFNDISERNKNNLDGIKEKAGNASVGSKAVSSALSSGLKGVSVLGAADTGCTVWNTARAVAAAAKATRLMQLVQFIMVFFNTADRIKAGDATPDEVSHLGDKITAIDSRKMVVDEESVWEGEGDNAVAKPHDNPYYGRNAMDSAGMKTAMYNEAPELRSRDLQYTIGGGLTGSFTGVLDKIAELAGGRDKIRGFCSVVQSWWARTAGLIAGLVSAVGSFGATTVISIGASVAIGFAMPFLEAALADIMAGTVVSGATEGVDLGDAAFAGAGGLLGGLAMGHGMMPANKGQLKSYMAIADGVEREEIAVETYEAKDTPFDVQNQYSFLGSAVRKINPVLISSSSSVSAAIVNIPSILSTAFSSITPHADAANEFNEERFSRCGSDQGYSELGIDADVFCNPRYAMSAEQLALDPDEVAKWMIDNGHVEEEGSPKSDEYKDWIKHCTEREDGWGETGNSDDNSDEAIGKTCVTKDKDEDELERLKYFGVYFMDYSIQDTMDNGYATGAAGGESGTTTASGTWVDPTKGATYTVGEGQDFGPRSSGFHDGIDLAYQGDFYSACTGTIKSVGDHGNANGGPTNIITIDCGGGITTKYMHYYSRDIDKSRIKPGAQINAGDKLAKVGNQGNSTGPHLHYQVEQNGKPIDPEPFMKKVGAPLR